MVCYEVRLSCKKPQSLTIMYLRSYDCLIINRMSYMKRIFLIIEVHWLS